MTPPSLGTPFPLRLTVALTNSLTQSDALHIRRSYQQMVSDQKKKAEFLLDKKQHNNDDFVMLDKVPHSLTHSLTHTHTSYVLTCYLIGGDITAAQTRSLRVCSHRGDGNKHTKGVESIDEIRPSTKAQYAAVPRARWAD